MFPTAVTPKKKPTYQNDSILESLRDISSGVGKTVGRDVVGKVATDTLTSLFGSLPKADSVRPRESFGMPFERPRPQAPRQVESVRPQLMRQEEIQIKQQLEAVRSELKTLAASVKQLNTDIQTAIAEVPVNPGIYHLNFFDRLRSILKILREHIDDSRSWMAMWGNRKKKQGYWGKYKKHGTQFGLSSERNVSTQAG